MYNENKGIMTVESLATAINGIPDLELEREESLKLSHRILNYFGYGGSVNDFILERDMRGIFYMLEDAGLLSSKFWPLIQVTSIVLSGVCCACSRDVLMYLRRILTDRNRAQVLIPLISGVTFILKRRRSQKRRSLAATLISIPLCLAIYSRAVAK